MTQSSAAADQEPFDIVVDARPTPWHHYFKDLWAHRELGMLLAKRDFLVRFKHTYVGLAWIAFRPLMLMLVLSFVFGKLTGFSAQSAVPYPLVVFTALIPWQFFSMGLSEVTNSLVWNEHILTKTYFPRMLLPFANLSGSLTDFCVSLLLLGGLFAWFGIVPSWRIVFLPLFMLLIVILVLGLGLWLSALNARFRDVQLLLPFALQVGMYLSPVGYRFEQVPASLQFVYNLNPLVGILEGFRWCLLIGTASVHAAALACSTAMALGLFISGWYFFRSQERNFADVI